MTGKKIKGFDLFSNTFMIVIVCYCLIPIVLLLISSFTDNISLIRNGYSFFPQKISADAYKFLIRSGGKIMNAYGMSFLVCGIGTSISIVITTSLAYAISKYNLPGRRILTFYVLFTMLFNGGLVPTYLMYTGIFHIKNTIFALIIPNILVRAFHVMLMRSFFLTSLPGEVIEAASIDGATEFQIFRKIAIPMSKPIIATVLLFTMIMYWNDWQNGLYYLTTKTNLYTIQNLLNRMIQEIQFLATNADVSQASDTTSIPSATVRMAIAVIGILPIASIYPFIQKYFVKGITLGAVKG